MFYRLGCNLLGGFEIEICPLRIGNRRDSNFIGHPKHAGIAWGSYHCFSSDARERAGYCHLPLRALIHLPKFFRGALFTSQYWKTRRGGGEWREEIVKHREAMRLLNLQKEYHEKRGLECLSGQWHS